MKVGPLIYLVPVADSSSAGGREAVQSAGARGHRDGSEESDLHAAGGQRQRRRGVERETGREDEKQRQGERKQEEEPETEEGQRVVE